MTGSPTSRGAQNGTALYVYGVLGENRPVDLFAGVEGIDAAGSVKVVAAGRLAAIVSDVPLAEFGEAAIEQRLRDPAWLEEKVRAHDRVLQVAVGRATVLPFRFGVIYHGEEQVEKMLSARPDFSVSLSRLEAALELGVKAFLDREALKSRLAAERGSGEESPTSGRAYMERRRLERELDEAARSVATERVRDSHERLAAAALGGRLNKLPTPELSGDTREIVMNAAYLVRAEREEEFRAVLAALESSDDEVTYELTGPWPPYNFSEEDEA